MFGHGAISGILLAALIVAGATGAAHYDNDRADARVARIAAPN
ncbi:MAG: hypothetical protein AAFY73_01115 [Pseudomonadota bacterium]